MAMRTSGKWKEPNGGFWSYSRLAAFDQCPRMYELTYIRGLEGRSNFFAEFGSFVHRVYEMYAKGELAKGRLADYYRRHFDEEVVAEAPYSEWVDYRKNFYAKGLAAMRDVDPIRGCEVLGVEKEVRFRIGGEEAVGFVDLVLRRRRDGAILVVDHKSSPVRMLKSGRVSKPDAGKFEGYRHQLYLYATPVIEEFGRVDFLSWNFFKDGSSLTIPFDPAECAETRKWAERLHHAIRGRRRFDRRIDQFFCDNICGQRDNCRTCGRRR